MHPLKEILDIIHEREVGDRPKYADQDTILSNAIEDVLTRVFREGKQEGVVQERKFWLGQED